MPRPARGPYLEFNESRGRWYILYRDAGRTRERSTGSGDREEANRRLAEFILAQRVKQQADGPRDPGAFPIADALTLYGAEQAPNTADPARIGYAITALLPYWGARTVADITKETCRGYVRHRGKAPGTVRRELAALRAALNYAKAEGRLTNVPTVHLPAKPEGKDRWLRRQEAAALLNAARTGHGSVRGYLPLFILLGLYTGARKEAILSLRWAQIDLDARRINFQATGTSRIKKGRAWGTACTASGLHDVTPHTLRHTCGTWLAQRGVPLDKIGGWLGHTDARTTQLYAHHHPDFMDEASDALDRRPA
jgi:integrase